MVRTHLNLHVDLGLDFVLVYLFRFNILCFRASLDHFMPLLFAFGVLGLVSSVPSHEIGWDECLRNDLFCVEWYVKLELNQSIR